MRGRKKSIKIRHEADTVVPEAPASLSAAACEHWHRLAPLLVEGGLLTPLQADLLAVYCSALALFAEADQHVTAEGPVGLSSTGTPMQNPYLAIRRTAAIDIKEYGTLLGIPLAARQRIKPAKADKPKSAEKWEGLIANG